MYSLKQLLYFLTESKLQLLKISILFEAFKDFKSLDIFIEKIEFECVFPWNVKKKKFV